MSIWWGANSQPRSSSFGLVMNSPGSTDPYFWGVIFRIASIKYCSLYVFFNIWCWLIADCDWTLISSIHFLCLWYFAFNFGWVAFNIFMFAIFCFWFWVGWWACNIFLLFLSGSFYSFASSIQIICAFAPLFSMHQFFFGKMPAADSVTLSLFMNSENCETSWFV